jgi:hypothetical protein
MLQNDEQNPISYNLVISILLHFYLPILFIKENENMGKWLVEINNIE